jgi:hypothetical protein
MKRLLLFLGIILLFATEFLRVYLIMPFPGSQKANTIELAYFIHRNRIWLRLLGLILVIGPLYTYLVRGKTWSKVVLSVTVLLYAVVFFFFNFRFEADKMFYQPGTVRFASVTDNKIPLDKLVIGITEGGTAKAYPIQIIGYHHQVRDSIAGTPIMVTYCTVCRTGRIFSPMVDNRPEQFRLVGMDHFNAMFEDATTKSWWQQATGVAIAGALKGQHLAELPSTQSTLAQWIALHPHTEILQPDTTYKKQYDDLAEYDNGTIKGSLEKRDSASWKMKSWVVGVKTGGNTKAYDWNELLRQQLIQDTVGRMPVMLVLNGDSTTFHVYSRSLNGQTLSFEKIPGQPLLRDGGGSTWDLQGKCIEGTLKDQQLAAVQSYQEFWHSWQQFHPGTTGYKYTVGD